MTINVVTAALMASLVVPLGAARKDVDTERSSLTVHVAKSGVFRMFGDNHEVQAPIKAGWLDDEAGGRVQISVDAQRMHVLDPRASPRDREDVQTRMLGPDVLDVKQFPDIRFESMAIEPNRSDNWTVHGQLTLRGQTRPVTVKVVRENGHYKGSASLKQTAFGITPITVGGGAVKVKDEVSIEFDIVTR